MKKSFLAPFIFCVIFLGINFCYAGPETPDISAMERLQSETCQNQDTCMGLCQCEVRYSPGPADSDRLFKWNFYNSHNADLIATGVRLQKDANGLPNGLSDRWSLILGFTPEGCGLRVNESGAADAAWMGQWFKAYGCRYFGPFCCCKGAECKRAVPDANAVRTCESGWTATNRNGDTCEPVPVSAVETPPAPPASAEAPSVKIESQMERLAEEALNPLNISGGPAKLIGAAIGFFMFVMGSIALVLYIWAGFSWMTASGNPEKITSAKRIFVWTTLGVVVILGSYMIVNFIFKTVLLLQ